MASLQEHDYGEGRNYAHGSPHIAHRSVRTAVEVGLHDLVRETLARRGSCHVVEVGAGHGTFTRVLLDAGATVTVTEMSAPSVAHLEAQHRGDERVDVVYDPDGELSVSAVGAGCDALVMISVLHHIPDYVDVVERLVDAMPAGGWFYSTQDPTWYPSRTRTTHVGDRGAYLAWRLFQGEVRRGLATRVRRALGRYEESNPSDMVEYHVVRQGVNHEELQASLSERFADVELRLFWTTQSSVLQRVGERFSVPSTFGLTARNKL